MSNSEKLNDRSPIAYSYISKGSYVTAKLVDLITSEGEEFHPVRQGVYIGDLDDGTIIVHGQTQLYRCLPDVHVIPDENLYGSAEKFAKKIRKSLV